MIYYKTDEEIEKMRKSAQLVSQTLGLVGRLLTPGTTGKEIDRAAEEFILDNKAIPGFKGYGGFPATLCISPNEQIVHGIPKDEPFKDGDIVSIDCGVILDEYYGDCAFTFAIGEIEEEVMTLLRVTHECLYNCIEKARVGGRLGDICYAVQSHAEKDHKYGVVRELVGHGIGKALHESPEVPNYGRRGNGIKLKDGLVIAVEPMINMGTRKTRHHKDGWTVTTADNKPSAHYEHTIAIRKSGTEILTTHDYVVEAIKNNSNLQNLDFTIKS